jgi:tetratricopeptide (TPR) repeat protein
VQNRVEKIEKILASKNLEIMFARVAANLLKRDNLEEAIHICENGMKKFATYAQGHYILARCYQKKGLLEEARAEFERVLKFDPNHLNALRELARIYDAAGLNDYYQDFLLKLFTNDPLNEEIVREVKKAGKYDQWIIQDDPLPKLTVQKITEEADEVKHKEDRTGGTGETTVKKTARPLNNLYEREKVDLSQFSNLQDDFTTILQGKTAGQKQDEQLSASTGIGGKDEKSEWVEEISYSYTDEKLPGQKQTTAYDKEEEEIETALKDLTFDEESEKIIENSQEQAKAQISLDLPDKSSPVKPELPGPKEFSGARQEQVSADHSQQLPAENIKAVKAQPAGKGFVEKNYPEGTHSEALFSASTEGEDESLPFKPPGIISQTLGEILVSQKKYSEALEIFRILKQKHPENKNFDKKIEFLQKIIDLEKETDH